MGSSSEDSQRVGRNPRRLESPTEDSDGGGPCLREAADEQGVRDDDTPGSGCTVDSPPVTPSEPAARTWRVLTVLGFVVPVGAYLGLLAHYQVNAISGDQWSDVGTVAQNWGHFPDWSSLWALHTDNRVFFPNLIVIALAHTVSFNIEVEEYLSALMLFASIALLIWAHKRRSPATPLLYYVPVAFVMLTFAQWQNTLWGFQMAWYLIVLAFAVSVTLLDRPQLSRFVFIGAVVAAIIGSYSSLQGLLIWPVGLLLLYYRGRPRWAFMSWIVAALATAGLYFTDYGSSSSLSSTYGLEHPVQSLKFFLFALGDVVGVPVKSPSSLAPTASSAPGNPAVLAFGVVILVLAVFVVAKWGLHRDERTGGPIGVALIVFGLLFDLLVTEGRVVYAYWGASQSRYVTFDVMVLVGIYLATLGSPAVDRGVVARVAMAAIVIVVAFGVHYGIEGARYEHQRYVASATITRNIEHESDLNVYSLYIAQSPQLTRQDAAFLREHHLSLYAS